MARADHLLGDVDPANPRLRELAREQQRALAGPGADLERPLGRRLDVQERGRQRREVIDRARAGALVPARGRTVEEAPHRAAERRPEPRRAHDQAFRVRPTSRIRLGVGRRCGVAIRRSLARASSLASTSDILPCPRCVRVAGPLACAADADRRAPARAIASPSPCALAALVLRRSRREAATTRPRRPCPPAARRSHAPPPKHVKLKPPQQQGFKPSRRWSPPSRRAAAAFTIALDTEDSPKTANSFAYLAERASTTTRSSTGSCPGFVIQGGDPTGTGTRRARLHGDRAAAAEHRPTDGDSSRWRRRRSSRRALGQPVLRRHGGRRRPAARLRACSAR